ncbi:MAG: hypothetical protein M1817_005230 [Caeruleum heppii]|nr:MAG: hypothetical protein M1817_005230 [Caeruleum heppii]
MVMQKLCDGADLMTPGLARGPPFPSDATKDSIVAVAALESPTVPTAVGVCVIDVNQLAAVRGEKGRAVETVHWSGDELWSWGSGTDTGDAAPEYLTGWDDGDEADEGLPGKMQSMKVAEDGDDQDGGVSIRDHHQADEDKADKSASSQRPNPELFEEVDVIEETLSTKDIDAIFHKAFLYGLHHFKSTKKNEQNHGLDFPVNSSFFMSNLVLPFLPIFTPAQGASLQIKKTSWKNAKKFIKHLEKQHLLRSKDRNGGETVVLEMDFDDPAVAEFVPYKLPKKESGQQHETSEGAPSRDQSIGQQLRRIVLYKPTEKLAPVFDAAHASLKAYYSASEIRSIVMTYIEGEQLISPANKRLVDINPVLANVVFGGQSAIDREVLAKGNVPRDTLVECIITRCSPYWAILSGEETKDKVKPKSGQAPPIQIMLETRTGNKTATKVSGMEAYHISPQALADEMQKACASSTSVGQLAGSSPKHPVMEVLIQGPQSQVVIKALEKRGVQRAWIDVVDKTKGKKR